jgi:hypothetical protein
MSSFWIALVVALAALAALGAAYLPNRRWRSPRSRPAGPRRILFPFGAEALSADALDSALRLACAEHATLVPVFLARVSLTLPLQATLPRQGRVCLGLQEAIEQQATRLGVPVDARIARGRSYRHALREVIASERFDRIVITAAHAGGPGIAAEDVRWLLDNAPGEILVLRPGAAKYIKAPGPPRAQEPTSSLASVG